MAGEPDGRKEASEGCGMRAEERCMQDMASLAQSQPSSMAPRGGGFGKRLDGWKVLLVLASTFMAQIEIAYLNMFRCAP